MRISLISVLSLCLTACNMDSSQPPLQEVVSSKYKVGQVWSYDSRPTEPESNLTIVKIERQDSIGNIIHIYVSDVKVKTSVNPDKYSESISHMPFSEAAIDSSVTERVGEVKKLPDFEEGYKQWRQGFNAGQAGVFSITVGKAVGYIEKTSLEGREVK